MNNIGACVYRSPTGNKCALGCLIPDSLYKPYMENNSVFSLAAQISIAAVFPNCDANNNMRFLHDLQFAHDDAANRCGSLTDTTQFIDNFKSRMEYVREKYNLDQSLGIETLNIATTNKGD